MNNKTPRSSIRSLPPGSLTLRRHARHLKKPPSPIDWVEQSYIELIQDVSLMTMNYYETKINQHAMANESTDNKPHLEDETLSLLQSLHDDLQSLDHQSLKLSSSEDETNEEGNDDDDYTETTTASSVCDLRNNLYQFYKSQAQHTSDISIDLTEEPILKMTPPYASSIITESTGYISPDDVSIVTTDVGSNYTVQEIRRKQTPEKYLPIQRKKKILARVIERMKLAAEKPFWSIESHF